MKIERILEAKFTCYPEAYRRDMPKGERETICSGLADKVQSAIAEGKRIPPDTLYKLSFFPERVQEMLDSMSSSASAFMFLASSNPEAAFRLMAKNYNSAAGERLELLLMSNPEYALKILTWAAEESLSLRYSEEAYSVSVYRDISCAWIYFRDFLGKSAEEFFAHMKALYAKERQPSAQKAFFEVCFEDKALSGTALNILRLDPQIALMTAISCEKCPCTILRPWTTYPRWAYHILVNVQDLPPEMNQNCLQTLIRALPWLYQYLRDTGLAGTDIKQYNTLMSVAVKKWKE